MEQNATEHYWMTSNERNSLSFFISKVVDVNGNYIEYKYKKDEEEVTPIEIIYGKIMMVIIR
ncbi:MAG: hypothetical protein HC906_09145 [Bacteroidales bacterium]|nr:hypothetical protein [Bacteroidales bacterium]